MAEQATEPEAPAGGAPAEQVDTGGLEARLDTLAGDIGGIREMLTAPAEPEYQEPYGGQDPYGGQQPQFPQYGQPSYPQQQQQQGWPGQQGYPQQQPGFGQQPGYQQQGPAVFPLDPANVYDDQGNVNPWAAQQYMQQLQQAAVEPAIQQAVAPIMQQLDQMRFDQGSARLEQQYPELAEKEKADALVARAVQMAPTMGLDPRQAVRNDGFLELVHQSMRAEGIAAGETPARGQEVHELESGGGAGPAGSPPSFTDQVNALQAGGADQAAAGFWGANGL